MSRSAYGRSMSLRTTPISIPYSPHGRIRTSWLLRAHEKRLRILQSSRCKTSMTGARVRASIAVDTDRALFELIAEWLAEAGHKVIPANASVRADLIVIDVPFPRQGG